MSAECGLLSHRLQAKLAVTTGENMKLNEKLVSLRKAQKLNQAQAAEALNVSRQAISTWETGAVLPSADSLKAFSRLYQVPVDHLLNDDMDLPQALVTEKEVGKQEESPLEPEHANTNSKITSPNKRKAIMLIYLLTILLVVVIAVAATLFVLWAREPRAIDLYDLDSEQVSLSDIEVDDFL